MKLDISILAPYSGRVIGPDLHIVTFGSLRPASSFDGGSCGEIAHVGHWRFTEAGARHVAGVFLICVLLRGK